MELKGYINTIRKKLGLIIAIVIVACTLSAVKSMYFTKPIYQANAKLIVNQPYESEGRSLLDYSTIQTNIMVINSYIEIIKSSAVMEKVVTNYPDLNISVKDLINNINVSTYNESQVMNLSYQDTSYKTAVTAVNGIAKVFKAQIPNIMKVDNVTILSEAKPDEEALPVNINPVMSILVSFVLGLMLAICLVFLLDYLDDTFKNEAELENELGLPTLAVIATMKKEDVRSKRKFKSNAQVGEGKYVTLSK
ncbi:Capsular polysaccharide type 8 biosynthesis protein cap8A [compost metagenome]